MTLDELDILAKTYVEAIYTNKLTVKELCVLMALIDGRLTHASGSVSNQKRVLTESTTKMTTEPAFKSTGVKYGGVYDAPPPMEPDPLPPADIASGKIIAKQNHACICNACKQVVYTVNRDIPDNCKVSEFVASFTPIPGYGPLPKTAEVKNVDGQISTDCPACKANKMLYLTG